MAKSATVPAMKYLLPVLAALLASHAALAQSRIKDIASIGGVRENALVGEGIVTGLAGTGDGPGFPTTAQVLRSTLNQRGVGGPDQVIRSRGAALVTISAALPPFARPGTKIDVSIGVLGDATSLQGGILQPAELVGPDGQVYAVAAGPISLGGFSASGSAQSVSRGVVSTGRIPNGATVERAPQFDLSAQSTVSVSLLNPDFSLARQVARAINAGLNADVAKMKDNANIDITIPPSYAGRAAELIADIENLPVNPAQSAPAARVVVDDRTGTIVYGEQVRISTVAITHGGLTVRVTEAPQVSQPAPFSTGGRTAVVPRTNIDVSEGGGSVIVLPAGSSIGDLVKSLNNMKVGVRDQIEILQAIKQAGAIQADVVTGR
jgi:flagellar P-ring protein precursor FlgI